MNKAGSLDNWALATQPKLVQTQFAAGENTGQGIHGAATESRSSFVPQGPKSTSLMSRCGWQLYKVTERPHVVTQWPALSA